MEIDWLMEIDRLMEIDWEPAHGNRLGTGSWK
jgi:hypothetical protein